MKLYIQAVPERMGFINQCIVPSAERHASIITDIEISVDHEKRGPLYGASKIWEKIVANDNYAMIIQDDIIFHKDFSKTVPDILAYIESGYMQAVSLFAPPRKIMMESYCNGNNFIENYDFLWLQGVIFTKQFCAGLLDFAETQNTKHDDSVVRDYSNQNAIPVWNCLPSLVQHDINIKSTMGTPKSTSGRLRRSIVWEQNIPANHFATVKSIKNGKPCK